MEVDRRLQYVEPDLYFWFVTGDCAKSLEEFLDKVKLLENESFAHHCNSEKNDFIGWITGVIGDKELADKLKDVTSKNEFVKILGAAVKGLKKEKPELELPSLREHLKQRRTHHIKELLEDINYKLIHHSDVLDKYDKVREMYKKLDKKNKQILYGDIIRTYSRLQEIWNRLNY